MRIVRALVLGLTSLCVALGVGWSVLAIWFDGPSSRSIATGLILLMLISIVIAFSRVRNTRRGLAASFAIVIAVGLWWSTLAPSNDRRWRPDVAMLPDATFDASEVTIHNLRAFKYRSENDFDQKWETRTYDLDKVSGVDLFLCFWGPTAIAHTIVSWEFTDGQHLAISIETRKTVGQEYSAIRGFFRQYELYYVVADERDVVGLRTNFRGERVYLYRLRVPPADARLLLIDYLQKINDLKNHPEWYNALTTNCTTTIRTHTKDIGVAQRLDWRLLANGYIDSLLYERGQINPAISLSELRLRSDITAKAIAADDAPDFSSRIREGLPAR